MAGAEGMFVYTHHSYRFRCANACKIELECEPNTIYLFRVRFHLPGPPHIPEHRHTAFWNMAGAEGIEPSSAVLETDILPLNYAPLNILYPSDAPHANTIVCDTIAHEYKKSSGNIIILFKIRGKKIFICKKFNILLIFINFLLA